MAFPSLARSSWAALAAAVLAAGSARAQAESPGGGLPPSDSADLRDAARDAQMRFERKRYRHLPWTRERAPQPCDEVVGRFCFWHEDPDHAWRPAPEAGEIVEAREALVAELAAIEGRIPGDGWVVGQRVRYLVEAARFRDATRAAAGCRAEVWWCAALLGHARHAAGDHRGAEAAFDEALAAMPAGEREAWEDLELVLEGPARNAWKDLGPGARGAFARRVWWLADPLWSTAGNERRAEHFSRRVLDRLQEGARSGYDVRWGSDLSQLLVRYGWPAGFERVRETVVSIARGVRPGIVAHDPPGDRGFMPPWEAIGAPALVRPGTWSVEAEKPRSAYAPAYAERFFDLEHQLAIFRREGTAVVVAGWEIPDDSLPDGAWVDAALVVSAGPDGAPRLARAGAREPRGVLVIEAPWAPAVVGVEALSHEAALAARARYGLPVTGRAGTRPAVSDLLLLASAEPLPDSLAGAAAAARGSVRIAPGEPLGLFWEAYPPAGAVEVRYALAVRDERGGFWRGLGARLGIGRRAGGEVALEWSEPVPEGAAVLPRVLAVELPALPEGDFTLGLTVRFDDGTAVSAERPIRVAPR